MKFICLKYLDRKTWEAMPETDRRGFLEDCLQYDRRLRENGHFFASEAWQTAGPAIGLRCSNGQLFVEDDKASQLLDGLMFLEARDLNHVIILVSDHPGVRMGWFEIHAADAGSLL